MSTAEPPPLDELSVFWRRDGPPGNRDTALEAAHLVIDTDLGAATVTNIDHAVIGQMHAVHGFHVVHNPLAQERAAPVHNRNAVVAARLFAVRDKDVAVRPVDADARRRQELRGVGIERRALARPVRGIEDAFSPICISSDAPSCEYFCTMPRGRAGNPYIVIPVRNGTSASVDREAPDRPRN